VTEMKSASDQMARGMEEQVRATRELDRGLTEREDQVAAMSEANHFQQEASQRLIQHFSTAEERLKKNVARASAIAAEIAELESLTAKLHDLGRTFNLGRSREKIS